jgi:RecA-family ATPase
MPSKPLPPIISIRDFETAELTPPEPILDGLLEQGSKMMLVGSSKGHKTWTLMAMASCLTFGTLTWLGFPVHQSRVLYINFEIQKWFCRERFRAMAHKMNRNLMDNTHLDLWNLRGYSQDESKLVLAFKDRLMNNHPYQLVIVDPFYKFSGAGKVENKAEDIASVMRAMDEVTVDLDVAVVFAHHTPKGDASERSIVDRGAGSGVFGRDPDAILSILESRKAGGYIAEFSLRNHPPIDPIGLRWDFPFFRKDEDVDISKAVKKPGRPKLFSAEKLLALLDQDPISSQEWQDTAIERLDISLPTFRRLRAELIQSGLVKKLPDDSFQRAFQSS